MKLNRSNAILGSILVIILIIIGVILFWPNVKKFQDTKYFYVRTGWTMADVDRELIKQRIIKRPGLYRMAKTLMSFNSDDEVHPGRYLIGEYTSNYSIIHRIKADKQDLVAYDMTKIKTPPQLVNMFYTNCESTEEELNRFFFGADELGKLGVDSMSLLSAFFRTKFEARWSDDYQNIMDSLHRTYLAFWSDASRIAKREKLGLSAKEVMVLTSIVQGEIRYDDEAGTVASVYLNRLKKHMKLQADPTVVYASGNFDMRRVSTNATRINSPFNTYMYAGLPPGPIQTVRPEIVDSVLSAPHTEYIFFCADSSRKGYHNFAVTYEEHKRNAAAYQAYLDHHNIH